MSFAVKLTAFLAAVWLCAVTTSAAQRINTTNVYNYTSLNVDYSGSTEVKFEVAACNDAHITLQPESPALGIDPKAFEVVIGGWGNTQSVIRSRFQGGHLTTARGRYLSCSQPRPFWVSWAGAKIRVGEGHVVSDDTYFMEVPMIQTIAVSSWTGTPAVWEVTGQTIYMPTEYSYRLLNKNFASESHLTFRVKTCNDAHLSLQAEAEGVDNAAYEIVIGGWSDSSSRIRSGHQGNDLAQASGSRLDCYNFRNFWVSWDENRLRVGTGNVVRVGTFMEAALVRNIGVSTGWGATGSWRIF